MSSTAGADSPAQPEAEPRLGLVFVLILLVEVATVVGLYWFGRYFGPS